MHTQDTIRTLNRLIRVCRDAEEFCRVGAGRARRADLSVLLRTRSEEWGRLGDELQALVLLLDGAPATNGTGAAHARRLWLVLRTALSASADTAIVAAWEDMQHSAWECYAEAISGYLPERIRRTVGLQADRIWDRCGDPPSRLRSTPALAGRAPRAV